MNLKWYVKQFNGLTTTQLHDIYQLRAKTFIKEQDRSYQDPDNTDLDARHVFAYNQGQLVAYARIYEHAGVVIRPNARPEVLREVRIDCGRSALY